jgi:hypothetical protein
MNSHLVNIQPGKRYITRGGKQARIYAIDGTEDFPVHGALKLTLGWETDEWDERGKYRADKSESPRDLMFEVVEIAEQKPAE